MTLRDLVVDAAYLLQLELRDVIPRRTADVHQDVRVIHISLMGPDTENPARLLQAVRELAVRVAECGLTPCGCPDLPETKDPQVEDRIMGCQRVWNPKTGFGLRAVRWLSPKTGMRVTLDLYAGKPGHVAASSTPERVH